ncbi:MAG: alpha/beta hydrolase, partial [Oscillatoriales cyanobacterium RM1_1_9]|nr:alpha/beta hydrolase [Oscillatoriales cyanobacterium RM1_1_9]
MLSSVCCCFPGLAAERVYLSFLSANISVSVQSLEDYVDQNVVSPELESYLLLLSAEDQAQFRTVLQDALKVDSSDCLSVSLLSDGGDFPPKVGGFNSSQSSQSRSTDPTKWFECGA